jgi:hypothetical protein
MRNENCKFICYWFTVLTASSLTGAASVTGASALSPILDDKSDIDWGLSTLFILCCITSVMSSVSIMVSSVKLCHVCLKSSCCHEDERLLMIVDVDA